MEYTIEYVSELDKNDEVIEQDGARVLIAPTAQMFLFGTEIDYETSLLESSFKFNNPNVSEACGCGESIKFKNVQARQQDISLLKKNISGVENDIRLSLNLTTKD